MTSSSSSGKRGHLKKTPPSSSKTTNTKTGIKNVQPYTFQYQTHGGGQTDFIQPSSTNNTLWILLIIFMGCMFFYVLWLQYDIMKNSTKSTINTSGLSVGNFDVLQDQYVPPVKVDGYFYDRKSSDIRGLPPIIAPIQTSPTIGMLPVNVETRGISSQYSQSGILTKIGGKPTEDDNAKLILPLMGRRNIAGRDKWQYYTISNTGFLNTKLPIRVNGRSCSGEYGCDQLMNGDTVYVEGYDSAFRATIYENTMFSYIPAIL